MIQSRIKHHQETEKSCEMKTNMKMDHEEKHAVAEVWPNCYSSTKRKASSPGDPRPGRISKNFSEKEGIRHTREGNNPLKGTHLAVGNEHGALKERKLMLIAIL
jgi:hypothetical protein